jgi:hypothetical protein
MLWSRAPWRNSNRRTVCRGTRTNRRPFSVFNSAYGTFLARDRGTARAYLRKLVDHIVLGEDEIDARANVALPLMAEPLVS